jgi:hypothetical protein
MQVRYWVRGIVISLVSLSVGHPALAVRVKRSAETPIVRAGGYVPPTSACYIERPNQLPQNLDEICQMGKPKAKPGIDMRTDRDKDGIPDELATEFRKLDAAMMSGTGNPAAAAGYQRRLAQALREMNERMPYAETSKAAMREMTQMIESDNFMGGGRSHPQVRKQAEAQFRRMEELNQVMRQDPMFNQIQQYSNRFNQLKYEKSRLR